MSHFATRRRAPDEVHLANALLHRGVVVTRKSRAQRATSAIKRVAATAWSFIHVAPAALPPAAPRLQVVRLTKHGQVVCLRFIDPNGRVLMPQPRTSVDLEPVGEAKIASELAEIVAAELPGFCIVTPPRLRAGFKIRPAKSFIDGTLEEYPPMEEEAPSLYEPIAEDMFLVYVQPTKRRFLARPRSVTISRSRRKVLTLQG